MAHNTFHVALYVRDLDGAIARYRKLLGQEPATVRYDYAKFEISNPLGILALNTGGLWPARRRWRRPRQQTRRPMMRTIRQAKVANAPTGSVRPRSPTVSR